MQSFVCESSFDYCLLKMSQNLQLEDGGSEQNNTLQDELVRVSPLTKFVFRNELESIVIRTLPLVIEPIIEKVVRKVVKEQNELAQEERLSSLKQHFENSTSGSRSLQLRFLDKVSAPVLTGKKTKGVEGTSIGVALFDGLTEKIVNSGPEASAKVEIVVLDGASDGREGENWTIEEFDSKIVRERKRKKSLLAGSLHLHLNEGRGVLGEVKFRHDSSWTKTSEFRLGARVVGNCNGTRVREAKTESFTVKDCRITRDKKHDPPSPSDDVWRLQNISKDGPRHKRLAGASIGTVKDFLTSHFENPEKLQNILRMSGNKWKALVNHAQRCKILEKECQYVPIDKLSETEKILGPSMSAKTWEATVNHAKTFKRDTSFLPGPSHSSNPSPHGFSFGVSHMIDSVIPSPVHSNVNTSNPGDSGLHSYSNTNHIKDQSSSFASQATNSLFQDLDDLDQNLNLEEWLQFPSEYSDLESHEIQQVNVSHMLINKARRRWTKVFNVLRWLFSRRFAGLKWIPAAKKARFC